MALIIAIDQAVKAAVRSGFEPWESKDILGSFFSLTYVQNTGAAFSMFSGQRWLLTAVPFIVILFGIWYLEKHRDEPKILPVSLALAIGGGISNLIDRTFMGFVTDMFDFHFWPVFNVADIAVCAGFGLLIIYILKYYGRSDSKPEEMG